MAINYYITDGKYISYFDDSRKYYKSEIGQKNSELRYEFNEKYVNSFYFRSSDKPNFNAFNSLEFKLEKNPKDIYSEVGNSPKGFIISPKMKSLLSQFKLAPHVIFDGITLKNMQETRNDYSYIIFYTDMWDYLDYNLSEFGLVSDKRLRLDFESIQFNSFTEYQSCKTDYTKEKYLIVNKVVIPGISNYDMFPLFNLSSSNFFLSDRIVDRIKAEKITGIGDIIEIERVLGLEIKDSLESDKPGNEVEIDFIKYDTPINSDIIATSNQSINQKEIKDLKKKLDLELNNCSNYFNNNTFLSCIEMNHKNYLSSAQDNNILNQIDNLLNSIDNLYTTLDEQAIWTKLESSLEQINRQSKNGKFEYDTILIEYETYKGWTDYYSFSDNKHRIQGEYLHSDLEGMNEKFIPTNTLIETFFIVLKQHSYNDLVLEFEEVEYLEMIEKYLKFKTYSYLNDLFIKNGNKLDFSHADSPLFIFIKDQYQEEDRIECLYVFH